MAISSNYRWLSTNYIYTSLEEVEILMVQKFENGFERSELRVRSFQTHHRWWSRCPDDLSVFQNVVRRLHQSQHRLDQLNLLAEIELDLFSNCYTSKSCFSEAFRCFWRRFFSFFRRWVACWSRLRVGLNVTLKKYVLENSRKSYNLLFSSQIETRLTRGVTSSTDGNLRIPRRLELPLMHSLTVRWRKADSAKNWIMRGRKVLASKIFD